jgi:cellulose biosynthesis protein BcsQ
MIEQESKAAYYGKPFTVYFGGCLVEYPAKKKITGIITVCSGKGGVGKTSSVLAIAGGLKHLGILPDATMDLDYGGSLTRAYGYEPATSFSEALLNGEISFEKALHETAEGIMVIPASASLASVEKSKAKLEDWRNQLREFGRKYLIIVDTSDDIFSTPVAAAILAADIIAIPVQLAKKPYERTFPEIAGLLHTFGYDPERVWFGVMVDQRATLPKDFLKIIADDGVELATLIPRSIVIDEADFKSASVVLSAPKSKAASAYIELATTIYARLRRIKGAAPGNNLGRETKSFPILRSSDAEITVNG